MAERIYLDHAATTPLDSPVLEAMLPYLTRYWGNPSSLYAEAQEARKGLDAARRSVAELLGCKPQEVIFTSGGGESNSLAIPRVETRGFPESKDGAAGFIPRGWKAHPSAVNQSPRQSPWWQLRTL